MMADRPRAAYMAARYGRRVGEAKVGRKVARMQRRARRVIWLGGVSGVEFWGGR